MKEWWRHFSLGIKKDGSQRSVRLASFCVWCIINYDLLYAEAPSKDQGPVVIEDVKMDNEKMVPCPKELMI